MQTILKTLAVAGAVSLAVTGWSVAQESSEAADPATTQAAAAADAAPETETAAETETATETAAEDSGEHKYERAADYYAECEGAEVEDFAKIQEQVRAFTDMKLMAATVNDPEKFFALMAVVNDPHTIHVMASCASEPVMWDTWMTGGTDMNNWLAAMGNMMNPAGMMKWMMAPMNPAIWEQMMTHADPVRYAKWSAALMNPSFYSPVTNMTKAEWYETRVDWLADPDSFEPILNFMMMDEYLNWGE